MNDDDSNAALYLSLPVPTPTTFITLISDQKRENTQQNQSKERDTLTDDNISESDGIPLRRSAQVPVKTTLYPGKICYN